MAEVVGLLVLEAVGVSAVAASFTIGSTGISLATVVGTAVIIGASVGLQYALQTRPETPSPEDGSIPLKQSIPPRIRAYGVNKVAGYFMLYEVGGEPPAASFDVMALHSGRISSFRAFYLSDDPIVLSTDISHGGNAQVVETYGDGRYGGPFLSVETRIGAPGEDALDLFISDGRINHIWTGDHIGRGIAYAGLLCEGVADVQLHTKIYPRGLPALSCVIDGAVCWDPRDLTQSRGDPLTWKFSINPVVQLIDYLTNSDGGMGLDLDVILPPDTLDAWMIEADLCDALVPTDDGPDEARYRSDGWFYYDNKPEDVIGGLLSTCDGWLAEAGDGTLSLTVGVYRAPEMPPLTERHIFGFNLAYGVADEQMVNQLEINYTSPAQKYVSVQADPWRDEASISESGIVRTQTLDLKWVQSLGQARRLGDRALQRLNPLMTGSFITTLYGLRYLGQRWVPLQYPFVSGLQDCVVEIQDAEVDLANGRITWQFIRIEPDAIEAYDPAADQGGVPVTPPPAEAVTFPMMREDGAVYAREDGSFYVRELV